MPAHPDTRLNTRPVAFWLFACCAMVFIMALLGAITRLTGSGLSMTDWDPIMGAIPPLNDADWNKAFHGYQAIPQYQILNRGMTLEEFKGIFFWEWLHRLWGRMIGMVFALPFLWFCIRGQINRATGLKLAGIFLIGGVQGFIGWFMVQSGLETRTSVSPYRLAMHLGFALLIYAMMLWFGLGLLETKLTQPKTSKTFLRSGWCILGLLATTMLWGAFVAGLHAGEAYNTWPLMEGEVLPEAAWTLQPSWINAFENLALVQFIHRWLGPLTMFAILGWVLKAWRNANQKNRKWLGGLAAMAIAQVGLGLSTLLSHIEIALATLHQAGAITLLTLLLINLWRSGKV